MGIVVLSGAAEPQLRPPQTNDAIIVPDGSQSWIPDPRKKDPLTYKFDPRPKIVPESTRPPDNAQPIDADIAVDATLQCRPVVHTLEFGEVLVDVQYHLKRGNFAAVVATADAAESLAKGSNEKLTIAALRVTAHRSMGDKQGMVTSLKRLLAVGCGLQPEVRAGFESEINALELELKAPPN